MFHRFDAAKLFALFVNANEFVFDGATLSEGFDGSSELIADCLRDLIVRVSDLVSAI